MLLLGGGAGALHLTNAVDDVRTRLDFPRMAERVHTIADFLAVVRKSGLLNEEQLAGTMAAWPDETLALSDELPRSMMDAGLLTQWQVDQLLRGKHKGFMLGKYKLLGLLGTGGMSSVYLAENPTINKRVAVKVLPVKRVEQTSFLARFEREARVAFQLGHQNIARAFDKEQMGSIHFIVMEYVEGIDLYAKVKQDGPLEVREAALYIRQAALGLHYAHEEGLVHRDIKPANLILDRKGAIKILDLGLALEDDDESGLTKAYDEKVLGTADYLAPEQARDSHKADRRSDIYALGCTLYYVLVGRAPFAQGKLAERIQSHLNKPPPNILEDRPDVPPAIAELYFRMMAKAPEARPQTAEEVADTLDAWLKGGTSPTGVAHRGEPPRRSEPPRRIPARRPGSSVVGPAVGPSVGPIVGPPTLAPSRPSSPAASSPGPLSTLSFGPSTESKASGSDSSRQTPKPTIGRDSNPSNKTVPTKPAPPSRKAFQADEPEEKESPSRFRFPRDIWGFPIGLWITIVGGVIAVVVLGTMVILRSR